MLYRKFLIWLTNTQIYSDFLLKVIPYIRFSLYYTPFRGNQYNAAYELIKKGDFIVCKDDKKLTTMLIGGDWSHAVMFLGKKEQGADYECAEFTHHNYTKSDFFDICKESSRIAIYRCDDFDVYYIDKVIEECKKYENVPYDVGFVLGIRALYCSELIFQSDFEHRAKFNLDDIKGLGQKYISPTGLTKASNVRLIYDSAETTPRY